MRANNPRGFFITGTDTGIGKTYVCCGLLQAFSSLGLRVAPMKPVASGSAVHTGKLLNEDTKALLAASDAGVSAEMVTPYVFSEAIAPHIAAQKAGVGIDFKVIAKAYSNLKQHADMLIVEGVGGIKVPLNSRQDVADLAKELGLPVILVVGMRLGCINHAILSAAAIIDTGLPFTGWIANCIDDEMPALDANIATLRQKLPAPLLGIIPHHKKLQTAQVALFIKIADGLR
jgi:dethiobiotin synthetase